MVTKARLALLLFVTLIALQLSPVIRITQAQADVVPYCITAPVAPPYSIAQCIDYTIPYVIIGLLLSFQVVAICYLIGNVLTSGSFKGWYQNELWECAKTVLLAGIIVGIIVLAGVLAVNVEPSGAVASYAVGTSYASHMPYCGTTVPTAIDPTNSIGNLYVVACNYLAAEVNASNQSYYALLGTLIGALYLESLTLDWYTPIVSQIPIALPPAFEVIGSVNFGLDFNFFASNILSFNLLQSNFLLDLYSTLVYPMLLITGVQYFLLLVFIGVGLGVLLPLGLILRAIPFLRSIGGSFIAVAIGVAVIYPCLLVFFNIPATNFFNLAFGVYNIGGQTSYMQQQLGCTGTGATTSLSGWVSTAIVYILDEFTSPALLSLAPINFYCSFLSGYNGGIAGFLPTGSIIPAINALMAYTIMPMLSQFILFVLDVIIVITITQSVAGMLGGEIRLGIGKMKLA